jgi:radical SAM-linked protein
MRLRFTFSKQGALRYTGHLDLHKIIERGLRRARLPLAYSKGYHPQPRLNLAAALPLGFTSKAEVMDVWFSEDLELEGLPEKLQKKMPPSLRITHVEQVDQRAPSLQTRVRAAEYRVEIAEAGRGSRLDEALASVMEAGSLPRERRGKAYDLRPLIEEMGLAGEKTITMRLAAREGATGRPEEVLAVLGIPLEAARVERVRLIFADEPS